MKIALVTAGFPPEIGGIESYVRSLSNELMDLGCDVDVLTQCPADKVKEWDALDVGSRARVLRFGDWTRTRQFRISPGLWRYLRIHGNRYDVINAHNFHASPALAASFLVPRPFVFTPHYHGAGHSAAARALHLPYDRLATRAFVKAASVLCVSDAERVRVVRDYPSIASRIHTVGIGVDAESIRSADPFETARPVVLVIGRLEAYKNVDIVIESIRTCPESDLIIVGAGPQKERLHALIRDMGMLGRVRMLERLSDDEVRRWQRTADVVVSLSSAEAYGLGVAESVVAGARVIASDIPPHREIASRSGDAVELLSMPPLIKEVQEALCRALAHKTRADCITMVPTWREIAQRTLRAYEDAISTSRSR